MLALASTCADLFARQPARYYIRLSIEQYARQKNQVLNGLVRINLSRALENAVSKLFKLRDWFTIKDAAVHLSSVMSEPVTEADVLRLVMDGHLKVSIFLGHDQFAVCNEALSQEQASDLSWSAPDEYQEVVRWEDPDGIVPRQKCIYLRSEDRFYHLLRGVHDFPLAGRQESLVEREYFRLTGGPNIDRARGVFVLMNEKPSTAPPREKEYFEIEGRFLLRLVNVANGDPTMLSELPEHSFFVIRTEALQQFSQSLSMAADVERTLDPREKNTYLSIIGSLADLYWKTAYPDREYTQATLIDDLEKYKDFPGMKERTLKDKLREAVKIIRSS